MKKIIKVFKQSKFRITTHTTIEPGEIPWRSAPILELILVKKGLQAQGLSRTTIAIGKLGIPSALP